MEKKLKPFLVGRDTWEFRLARLRHCRLSTLILTLSSLFFLTARFRSRLSILSSRDQGHRADSCGPVWSEATAQGWDSAGTGWSGWWGSWLASPPLSLPISSISPLFFSPVRATASLLWALSYLLSLPLYFPFPFPSSSISLESYT